jgi:predicted esterase
MDMISCPVLIFVPGSFNHLKIVSIMKLRLRLKPVLFLSTVLCSYGAFAQQTGSFNEDITFMSAQRRLSCYVPTNYNAATPARLIIGLHGLGDNSTNYRNALVNSLGFAAAVPNTILVCPDGGSDPNSDFYFPVGDEAIIEESIAFAKANYNIDTTEIVLQGFSLGGRSALRYGLLHTSEFKGLLLTTPATQGVKEAVQQYGSGGMYDYDQAPQIPIYITHGNTDDLYRGPIDSVCEQLVRHDAAFKLYRFNGGHTVPPFADIQDFNTFFEQPLATGEDVRVAKVIVTPRSCNTNVSAKVLVQNTGLTPLTSIGLTYAWNSALEHYTWNGTLAPKSHIEISLTAFTATQGSDILEVAVDTLNGTMTDTIVANNTAESAFRITTTPLALPLTEHFDDDSYGATWLTQPSGDYILPWSYDDEFSALFTLNSIFVFDNSGRKEEIQSPVLNLSSLPNPFLSFDVAFNYTTFTAAFLGVDATFSDTLEVLVSTDCGETFQSVYKKSGAALATFASPILNPASLDDYFFTPADSNWRRETIDLSPYATSQDAVVKFSYISGLGGSILLDNIAFVNEQTGIREIPVAQVNIYPNPVQDQCKVACGNDRIQMVTVHDVTGKKVMSQQGNNASEMTLSTATLPNGVYLLDIITEKGKANKKIVVQH